jgi:hypothetical protein
MVYRADSRRRVFAQCRDVGRRRRLRQRPWPSHACSDDARGARLSKGNRCAGPRPGSPAGGWPRRGMRRSSSGRPSAVPREIRHR